MAEEAPPPFTPEERIRLEALNLAHTAWPAFLQTNQGNIQKARAEIISLAKRYETFVKTGKTLSADDHKSKE